MILKRLKLDTPLGEPTNCYIIVDEETKETMVIDPAGEEAKIIDMLNILFMGTPDFARDSLEAIYKKRKRKFKKSSNNLELLYRCTRYKIRRRF